MMTPTFEVDPQAPSPPGSEGPLNLTLRFPANNPSAINRQCFPPQGTHAIHNHLPPMPQSSSGATSRGDQYPYHPQFNMPFYYATLSSQPPQAHSPTDNLSAYSFQLQFFSAQDPRDQQVRFGNTQDYPDVTGYGTPRATLDFDQGPSQSQPDGSHRYDSLYILQIVILTSALSLCTFCLRGIRHTRAECVWSQH